MKPISTADSAKKVIETQEHILQNALQWLKLWENDYENIFRDDVKAPTELADFIIKVEGKLQNPELANTSCSIRSEPPD